MLTINPNLAGDLVRDRHQELRALLAVDHSRRSSSEPAKTVVGRMREHFGRTLIELGIRLGGAPERATLIREPR
jgi:hypothetical protein